MQTGGPPLPVSRSLGRTLACAAFLGAAGRLHAEGTDTLAGIPLPDVLTHRAVQTALTWRSFTGPAPTPGQSQLTLGPDLAIVQGFADRFEAGFAAAGGRHDLQLVSGRARLRLLDEHGWQPALAVGVLDLTGDRHPFGESLPPVAPAGAYAASAENNSFYGVLATSFGPVARLAVGGGTGRFVGREADNRWAHGGFAGVEARLVGPVSAVASFDGRGYNAGLAGAMRVAPGRATGLDVGVTVAARHLENLSAVRRADGLRPVLALEVTIALAPVRRAESASFVRDTAVPGPGAVRAGPAPRPKSVAKKRRRPAAPPKVAPTAPGPDANAVELTRLATQIHALRDKLASIQSSGYAALAEEQVRTATDALERGEAALDGGDPETAGAGVTEASTALDAARRAIESETGRPLRW